MDKIHTYLVEDTHHMVSIPDMNAREKVKDGVGAGGCGQRSEKECVLGLDSNQEMCENTVRAGHHRKDDVDLHGHDVLKSDSETVSTRLLAETRVTFQGITSENKLQIVWIRGKAYGKCNERANLRNWGPSSELHALPRGNLPYVGKDKWPIRQEERE